MPFGRPPGLNLRILGRSNSAHTSPTNSARESPNNNNNYLNMLMKSKGSTRVNANQILAYNFKKLIVFQSVYLKRWASSQTQHQVKRGFLLDVVVGKCAAVLQLLASEDEALLIRRDSFFVLNLLLDILNAV